MPSKVRLGIEILQKEGPLPLTKKASLFLASQTTTGRKILYKKSKKQIKDRIETEEGLNDILDTVLNVKPGYPPYQVSTMQLRDEIKSLTELVTEEEPKTILEIGTARGGSFYIWSRYLDSASKLISLDLPGGEFGGGYDKQKTSIFRDFSPSKEMHFIRRNSHDPATAKKISEVVDEGIDFLFIDGDHSYKGVKQDFEMYSELMSDEGIIALHDIATHPNDREVIQQRRRNIHDIEDRHLLWGESHPNCNVDRFWAELKEEYETKEIISHPQQTWAGIGIVRL